MKTEIKGATSTATPSIDTPEDSAATAAAESRTGPRSPVVKFKKEFDYTWPSRAMTNYPKGYQGRVKAEVADAAQAAGVLTDPVDGETENA